MPRWRSSRQPPAWAPDGTQIAYIRLDPFAGGPTINVIGLEGGESTEVAEDASAPRWSPDGDRIAFMSVDGGMNQLTAPPPSELRVVNADGTGLATLADASPYAGPPAWSPDGASIAVTGGSETESTIDVVDVGSGAVTTLAGMEDAILVEPAWAPDGRHVPFVISTAAIFSSEAAIGVVPAEGGEIERLGALDNAYFMSPAWSPDGAWLARCVAPGWRWPPTLSSSIGKPAKTQSWRRAS